MAHTSQRAGFEAKRHYPEMFERFTASNPDFDKLCALPLPERRKTDAPSIARAIHALPLTVDNFRAVIEAVETMAHAFEVRDWSEHLGDVQVGLTDVFAAVESMRPVSRAERDAGEREFAAEMEADERRHA